MNLDILIIGLMLVVPYVIMLCLAKHKNYIERKHRNEIINNFKFEEFNTCEG